MIEKLKQAINECNKIVFFTGAGMSTDSGIPDFRSATGLYTNNLHAEEIISHHYFMENTKEFYDFYKDKMIFEDALPNYGHNFIVELEKQGKEVTVVTQNIDGLHQKAGSKKVYEIHGTTYVNHCSKCKKEYPTNYIFDCKQEIPTCECGGLIRPDVTLYGESLPNDAVNKAVDALDRADCLIIAGTSLSVYPAASFIQYFHGKHIVIINRDFLDVPYMTQDDLQINENMSDTFEYINTII